MPLVKFNRNFYFGSLSGHAIYFEKGVEKEVPQVLIREVLAAGGIVNEKDVDEATKEADVNHEIPQGIDREKKILEAFGIMMGRTNRGDFTAGGAPNCTVLSQLAGFEVQSKERDVLWLKYQETPEEER